MLRPLTFACASALALAFAAPAVAQDEVIVTAPPTSQGLERRVVQFGDLDLYDDRGARTLVQRIEHAAMEVCGNSQVRLPLPDQRYVEGCTRETMDMAIADIDHPYVSARYFGYTPVSYYSPKG